MHTVSPPPSHVRLVPRQPPVVTAVAVDPARLLDRPPRPRRMLLVDDHALVRLGVKALYGQVRGTDVDWLEATTLQEAIDLYQAKGDIDAVLLDLNLADSKGLQGLRRFIAAHPLARVAVFNGTQDESMSGQARALGAQGYLSKGAGMVDMQNTLTTLLWPKGVPQQLDEQAATTSPSALFLRFLKPAAYDRVAELGPRHLEILGLVLSGCTNQEIGDETSLPPGTVRDCMSSLLLALNVRSRSHLISLFR